MTQGPGDTRRNTDLSQRRKRKSSNMGNLIKPQAKKNVSISCKNIFLINPFLIIETLDFIVSKS